MVKNVEKHLRKMAPNKAPVIEEARKLLVPVDVASLEEQRQPQATETADAIAA